MTNRYLVLISMILFFSGLVLHSLFAFVDNVLYILATAGYMLLLYVYYNQIRYYNELLSFSNAETQKTRVATRENKKTLREILQ